MILAFKIVVTVYAALMSMALVGAIFQLEDKADKRALWMLIFAFLLCITAIWL